MLGECYTTYMVIIDFFVAGYIILMIALVINILAAKAGLGTWYEFIKSPKTTSILSIMWLVWLYPLTLGFSSYFAVSVIF